MGCEVTDLALFDVPSIFPNDDTARTRKSDPHTSHVAGDRSQRGMHESKRRILQLVRMHEPICGSDLNDQYRISASRLNWKTLAWDSPRKRAGELADDGFLEVVDERLSSGNHSLESVYALTDLGREALNV